MTTAKNLLITAGLTIGLLATGGGTAIAATPSAAAVAPAAAVTQPSHYDRDYNDREKNRNKHRWHGNKRWHSVSPWQCRRGGGWASWRHDRCWGGRYHGAKLRRW